MKSNDIGKIIAGFLIVIGLFLIIIFWNTQNVLTIAFPVAGSGIIISICISDAEQSHKRAEENRQITQKRNKQLQYEKRMREKEEALRLKEKELRHPRYISAHVKREVWRRDQGKYVECNSKIHLEYDHIIPHSLGGSNTARNIQLLCEKCNRTKHNTIK